MMENSQKLTRFEFKNYVPKEMIMSYFDSLYWNDNLYLCLIDLENDSPRMYLESTKSKDQIIRVFNSLADVAIYSSMVCEKEKISPESVKKWEIKFHDLLQYLNRISKKYKKQNKKALKVIASGIYDEKLVELDVLWTDIDKFIN